MSVEAMVWALNDAPVTDQGQLLVLLGIANHATREGERAFPSVATLADYARCSVRTVHRHLKALEDAGVIVRGDQDWIPSKVPANRRPVVYDLRMNLTRGVTPVTCHQVAGLPNPTSRGDSGGSSGVTTVADKPSFFLTEETVLEPSLRATGAAASRALTDDFKAWYAQYPKKVDPKIAERAYIKARKEASAAELLDGLARYCARLKAEGTSRQHTKNPASWLNAGAWMDERPAVTPAHIDVRREEIYEDENGVFKRRWT